jgi:hypothetical protein
MLNSVSFNPSFSGMKVPPTGRGGVKIGDKFHPVMKVLDAKSLEETAEQVYRDVVFIEGKMYPVKKLRSYGGDVTEVVQINGKTYRVNKNVF